MIGYCWPGEAVPVTGYPVPGPCRTFISLLIITIGLGVAVAVGGMGVGVGLGLCVAGIGAGVGDTGVLAGNTGLSAVCAAADPVGVDVQVGTGIWVGGTIPPDDLDSAQAVKITATNITKAMSPRSPKPRSVFRLRCKPGRSPFHIGEL